MATVTEAQQSDGDCETDGDTLNWRTLWITILAVGWGAVIVGIVGAYFFKWDTGFPLTLNGISVGLVKSSIRSSFSDGVAACNNRTAQRTAQWNRQRG